MSNETPEEDGGFEVDFEFSQYDGKNGAIDLRTVLLGDDPIVLIEPATQDGPSAGMRIKTTTSMIGLKDLEVVLSFVLKATKEAQLQEARPTNS